MATVPRRLEAFVAWWLPCDLREEVLGDLSEKYQRPLQYLLLFLSLMPSLLLRFARRRIDAPLLAMEALAVYLCYLSAAWYADRTFLISDYGLLRLLIPVCYVIPALAFCEISFAPTTSPLKLFGRTAYATVFGFAGTGRASCGHEAFCLARTLPDWTDIYGSCAVLIALSAIHILFRRSNLGTPRKG